MEQRRGKLALGRLIGEVLREDHHEMEEAALPDGPFLARDPALPSEKVGRAVRFDFRPGEEQRRMVFAKGLSLRGETGSGDG